MQQSRQTSTRNAIDRSDAANLCARLRERIMALQLRLDLAASSLMSEATSESIHGARVAARRLRAFLRAFRGALDARSVKQYRRSLKALTHDLEEAREADVRRSAIAKLTKTRGGNRRAAPDALQKRATDDYRSTLRRLGSTVSAARWQRRLAKLRRLSRQASLVLQSDEPAAIAIDRCVDRRRRRLRDALRSARKNVTRLHRLRLKIKELRYLMEDCYAKMPLAPEAELKGLQRLQDCLGDLHDDENLRAALRTKRMPRRATRGIIEQLERRKHGRFKEFKKRRKVLLSRWTGLDCATPRR
jgi:CHAD domain-containing protein